MIAFNDAGHFNRSRFREQFTRLKFRGQCLRVWAAVVGSRRGLVSLAEVEAAVSVHGRRHAGIQSVALAAIVGSEGRCADFDRAFRPLRTHSQERWMGIALAKESGEPLPVIELVQIGDYYFVRDGHHRLSVAGLLGQREIEAEVTVWETNSSYKDMRTLIHGTSKAEAALGVAKQIVKRGADFVHQVGSRISNGGSPGGLSGGGLSSGAGRPAMQGG